MHTQAWPDSVEASSIALRVSLVNLQKLTFQACEDLPSMRMLAPAQNTRSLAEVSRTAPTSLAHVHAQRGHAAVEAELPVLVARGLGPEIHHRACAAVRHVRS